jgi:hypothetical protein
MVFHSGMLQTFSQIVDNVKKLVTDKGSSFFRSRIGDDEKKFYPIEPMRVTNFDWIRSK